MKESVTIAKEAKNKKEFSSTRSDNNIQGLRNKPERQLGSLRGVVDTIRRDGGTPSVESIATELGSKSAAKRTPVLRALQQTHGNMYVQRVVAGIQAKLVFGQPGDKYEQEADRVADAVMRMPVPQTVSRKDLDIQRVCQGCEEEGLRRQPEEEEEELLQTKEISGQNAETTPDFESRINSIRGGGKSLSKSSRAFFEPRFGADFSGVRVHTDGQAASTAKSVNAKAFTVGHDVVFGAGQYMPDNVSGQKLLAHELTHVIQQNGGGINRVKMTHIPFSAIIQRWEASEHVQIAEQVYTGEAMKKHFTQILGKDASIKLSLANAQISYAQAAAMADLFEDFKQMYNAPKHEIDTHLSIIKSEKSALITERKGKSKKKPLSEQSKTILKEIDMRFTKATAVRYLDLAKKNYSHFTHVHIGGGNNNIQEWQKLHGEAADVAQQAKKNKSANELSMAFARNSFADHYLMDAFAVGHLTARSTKEDEDDMRKHIASKLDDVITEVLIEKIGTKWYLFFLLITPGLAHLTALLAFLTGQGLAGREDIKSLPFKIVHDMDNKYGRRVANKKGDEWEAYGDKFLLSKENLESNYPRVVNAVKISKNELIHSASKNEKPGNKPIELYPSSFEKRNWNEEMAVKALKNLVSEKFSMLKLLWTTDNIVRRYIEKTTPEEMYKISPDGKVRMINELLPGWTGGADERAILKMMKYSQSRQVFNIMEQIGLSKLAANIHGKEYKQFISLLANKYSKLPVNLKIIFINKLLEGATLDVEENGILQLLRHSSSGEVYRIVNDVRFKELADNIHGAEYDKFIYILENKYRNVGLNGKKELINALLQVTTGDLEEWAINEIIRNAKSNDVATIINTIGFGDFDDNIHGGEYRTFLNVLVNKYKYLDVVQKIRLIKALCSGSTSEVEEETIISLLKDALTSSKEDFKTIVRKVGKSELYSELTGREENQFEEMLENTGMK